MHIETERLTVRDFRAGEGAALLRVKNDPAVREFVPDLIDNGAGLPEAGRAAARCAALLKLCITAVYT